jgi:hypothetical protein
MMWHRYRIVVPAFDEEQANRLAEKISEFCGCAVEVLWSMTNDECSELLGDVVMKRTLVPTKIEAPAEGDES